MAITILLGELARPQGSDEKARAFLKSQQDILMSFGNSMISSGDDWEMAFLKRFKQNVTVVFQPISVGPDKK
jgi:hypothetical protein